jgi:hypothetical protein
MFLFSSICFLYLSLAVAQNTCPSKSEMGQMVIAWRDKLPSITKEDLEEAAGMFSTISTEKQAWSNSLI